MYFIDLRHYFSGSSVENPTEALEHKTTTRMQAACATIASLAGGILFSDLAFVGLVLFGLVTLPFSWPVVLGGLAGIAVAALVVGIAALGLYCSQSSEPVDQKPPSSPSAKDPQETVTLSQWADRNILERVKYIAKTVLYTIAFTMQLTKTTMKFIALPFVYGIKSAIEYGSKDPNPDLFASWSRDAVTLETIKTISLFTTIIFSFFYIIYPNPDKTESKIKSCIESVSPDFFSGDLIPANAAQARNHQLKERCSLKKCWANLKNILNDKSIKRIIKISLPLDIGDQHASTLSAENTGLGAQHANTLSAKNTRPRRATEDEIKAYKNNFFKKALKSAVMNSMMI